MILATRIRFLVLALTLVAAGNAPAASPSRGVSESEISFGMTAGFTGTSRELAQSMRTGIEVAFAEINAAGGLYGRKLKLVGADHGDNPAKAVALTQELVEQKNVLLLLGSTGPAALERQLPYLLQQRVILFGAVNGGDCLHNIPPDRYVFNFRPSYAEEVQLAVRHLVEVRRLKPDEIAFFGQEDSFGDSGWRGFSKVLRRYQGDPSRTVHVGYRPNTLDVSRAASVLRARASHLKAVVTCGTHQQVAALIGKVRDLKLTFTALSAVEANALADDLVQMGPQYAEGVIVTQVVPMPASSSSAVIHYREQLKKFAPSARPDYVSLESFLSTLVLIEGLRRTGNAPNTEALADALQNIHGWDLGLGAVVDLGPLQHDASNKVWGTVLAKDGTFQPLQLTPQ